MIATTRRTPWSAGFAVGLGGLVVFRVVLEVAGMLATYRAGVLRRLAADPAAAVNPWRQWDVNWFADLATRGYAAMGRVVDGSQVHDGTAFPPAVPAVMWAGLRVGLSPAATGFWASAVFLLLALAILHVLVADDFDESIGRWSVAFLLVYPFSLFSATGYAESLVLLATVGAWLAGRRRHWWLAGVLVGVALLAKIVFILLLVPLTLEALEWRGGLDLALARRRLGRVAQLVIPALAALAGWMLYLQATFGQPLRFLTAQAGWGRAVGLPLGQVALVLDPRVNAGVRAIDAVDAAALVLLAVMTVYVYRRVRPTYGVLLGLMLAVFTFNTSLVSNSRHIAVLFPVFLGFALWTRGRPWLRRLVLLVQVPAALLLVTRFVTGHWAG